MKRRIGPLFDQRAKLAVIVVAITLAFSGVVFRSAVQALNIYLRKEPVAMRHHLLEIPRTIGVWRAEGEDLMLDGATVEALGTDKYLNRKYVNTLDPMLPPLNLHIAYYTGMIDAVPHIPDRCFVAGGWTIHTPPSNRGLGGDYPGATTDPARVHGPSSEPYRTVEVPNPVTGRLEAVDLPIGDLELRVSSFEREEAGDRLLVAGYLFIANHLATPNPEVVRSMAFRPTERYAYFAKVQLATMLPSDAPPERFAEVSSEFTRELIPHLMRCLPDWSAVEAGEV